MAFLPPNQRSELKAHHRCERDRRVCDRIKAVLLYDKGWTYQMIGEALLLDDQTVGNYVKAYREYGKLKHESGGSSGKLTQKRIPRIGEASGTDFVSTYQRYLCLCQGNLSKNLYACRDAKLDASTRFCLQKPQGNPGKSKR